MAWWLPDECRIIIIVDQQSQVRQQILDLSLVEKGLATRQQIGNALLTKRLFEHTCLMVTTIENGVIGELGAMLKTMAL